MSRQNNQIPAWAQTSPQLHEAYMNFILSRKAMMCSQRTIDWYSTTLATGLGWMIEHQVYRPKEITAHEVRAYLASVSGRGLTDSYIHNHARVIRTLLIFWHKEKYTPERVQFEMPILTLKKMHFLTANEIQSLIAACVTTRDRALVLVMVDTGVRRAELCALKWQDVDIASGLVRIMNGKGGKARSVVVGVRTRRALLAYQREVNPDPADPVFQTSDGQRLLLMGVRSTLNRLGDRAGVKVNAHAMRRTFAALSMKAGMIPLHLQTFLGHATLEMTRRYPGRIGDDLIEAHRKHGSIDTIFQK